MLKSIVELETVKRLLIGQQRTWSKCDLFAMQSQQPNHGDTNRLFRRTTEQYNLLQSRQYQQVASTSSILVPRRSSWPSTLQRSYSPPRDDTDKIPRRWRTIQRPPQSGAVEFSVMSYNMLAQDLLMEHPYLYSTPDRGVLQWEMRWKNLYEELRTLLPDIMCLQEVQASHRADYYCLLGTLGYEGIYKKRTGIRCDGCAIYYKPTKFTLMEYETVEFYQPNVEILNRDNVAIIAMFAAKAEPNKAFIVATTHLLYNPKRQDVRLAQTQVLLTEIERMSFNLHSSYLPVILTGDFNSLPNSVVYRLITEGSLKYSHLAKRRLHTEQGQPHGDILIPSHLEITDACKHASLLEYRVAKRILSRLEEAALIKLRNSDKCIMKIRQEMVIDLDLYGTGTLSHSFNFRSVYNHGTADNPEGTTFQDEWITVDYIFYTTHNDQLKLLSFYKLPKKRDLNEIKLPNRSMGSDHLCLMAKFCL